MRGRSSRLSVLFALVLCACGSQATPGASTPTPTATSISHGSIRVAGLVRTYRLFQTPSLNIEHPVSLVLLLHGCASSGDRFASITQFEKQAGANGFVAAYPDGLASFGPGFDHCWNEFLDQTKPDDLAFLTTLIGKLTADLPIDKNRIFVTGLQSGGHMAYTLACSIPQRITAIASVSGGMPIDERKQSMGCPTTTLAKPVSVMEMHGTADDFVPYDGGGGLDAPPIVDVVKYWAMLDGCSGAPSVSHTGITSTSLWKQCGGAAMVRLDTVAGGHNTWFGSSVDPVAGEPNASQKVWAFFNGLPSSA